MMERVTCSCAVHKDLVVSYARGKLDDDQAACAEDVLSSCTQCASWMASLEHHPAYSSVNDAVGEALAQFRPARHHRHTRWWQLAAAAAVIAIAGSVLWFHSGTYQPAATDTAMITTLDFESWQSDGTADSKVPATTVLLQDRVTTVTAPSGSGATPPNEAQIQSKIFTTGFEAGEIETWGS